MGIPWRLVVSEKTMKKNNLELKRRSESEVGLMEIKKALDFLKKEAIALCEPS